MKNNLYLLTTFNGNSPALVWAKNDNLAIEEYKAVKSSSMGVKCTLIASGLETLDVMEKFLKSQDRNNPEKVTYLMLA